MLDALPPSLTTFFADFALSTDDVRAILSARPRLRHMTVTDVRDDADWSKSVDGEKKAELTELAAEKGVELRWAACTE
jgi:hypothetical protein